MLASEASVAPGATCLLGQVCYKLGWGMQGCSLSSLCCPVSEAIGSARQQGCTEGSRLGKGRVLVGMPGPYIIKEGGLLHCGHALTAHAFRSGYC